MRLSSPLSPTLSPPTLPAPPGRTRKRRKAARPGEILDAALEVFVARGYAATRMEDVAQRARVSKGTVYLYYANKTELFKAVVRQAVIPNLEAAERQTAVLGGPAWPLIERLLRDWWRRTEDSVQGGLTKLIMAESENFPEIAAFYRHEVVERAHAVIAALLHQGVASGEFRSVPPRETALLATAPLFYQSLWQRSRGLVDPGPDLLEAHLQHFRAGLEPATLWS